ncbi:MAG: LysE family translocator [Tidjanibacter sp.]|nr:LysE family translocator [Tidjanibacter sp.]
MWIKVFIGGIMVGFLASIPPGPVGIMCIQRTLSKGWRSGFFSGLGAATCDTIFASIAFLSLAFVTETIENNMLLIKGLGGVVIAIVGLNIFFKNPVMQIRRSRSGQGSSDWQDCLSVFLLTLANPAYILAYVALIATVKAIGFTAPESSLLYNAATIVGIFAGCLGWWLLLSSGINMIRSRFRPRHLLWLNRISGAIITLIGLALIVSMISNFQINELVITK